MDAYIADLFARLKVRPATAAQTAVTAGGSGDATEVNGLVLNLDEILTEGERSIAALIFGVASVNDAETLSLAANWQQADNLAMSANAEDIADPLVSSVVMAPVGAAVVARPFGVRLELNRELVTRTYIRVQFTPNLSRTGTDTATIQAAYIVGQGQVLPYARVQEYANAS